MESGLRQIDPLATTTSTACGSSSAREKAMRIASIDELETGSSTARWSSPGGAEFGRTGRADELVRSLVGITEKEEDFFVASDSKSELWRD